MQHDLISYIVGGGFVSMLVALLTLRSQVRKVRAQSSAVELQNSEKATEILMENIVEPLKAELHETRRELSLLRNALHEANHCRYHIDCPVLLELHHRKTHPADSTVPSARNSS